MSQSAPKPNASARYRPRAAAAQHFQVAESTVASWCARGLVTAYRHSGRVYVDLLEISEALARHGRRVMRDGRDRGKPLPHAALVDEQYPSRERLEHNEASS